MNKQSFSNVLKWSACLLTHMIFVGLCVLIIFEKNHADHYSVQNLYTQVHSLIPVKATTGNNKTKQSRYGKRGIYQRLGEEAGNYLLLSISKAFFCMHICSYGGILHEALMEIIGMMWWLPFFNRAAQESREGHLQCV